MGLFLLSVQNEAEARPLFTEEACVWGMGFLHLEYPFYSPMSWQKSRVRIKMITLHGEGLPLLDSWRRRIIICFWHHQKNGLGTGVPKQARDAALARLWVGLRGWMSQMPGFPEWVLSGCRESSSLYPKKKLMDACNCPDWGGVGQGF